MKVTLIILMVFATVLFLALAYGTTIASAQDLNCDDIGYRFYIDPANDPNNFDGDGDGIACEAYPWPTSTQQENSTVMSTTATSASSIVCGLAYDRNSDGISDAWDRNKDGDLDAFDVNYDGIVDRMDLSISCGTVTTGKLPTTGAPLDALGAIGTSLMGVGGLLLRRKS